MAQPDYTIVVHQDGVPYEFKLTGGPIDAPDFSADLFAAIGHAATSWARLEQHLDALLVHVNKAAEAEIYNAEHPISFQGKIKLLKNWFNKSAGLSRLSGEMRYLTSSIKKLTPHRNLYLHSTVEDWNATDQVATFNSMKYEGNDEFQLKRVVVPLSAIKAFARLANTSNRYLATISKAVFEADALKRSQKP
jgi:hypothetical protein